MCVIPCSQVCVAVDVSSRGFHKCPQQETVEFMSLPMEPGRVGSGSAESGYSHVTVTLQIQGEAAANPGKRSRMSVSIISR